MQKKNIVIIIVVILIILGGYCYYSFSSTTPTIVSTSSCSQSDIELKIKDIADNLTKYSTTSKDILGLSTEGGEQVSYIDQNKQTRYIAQTFLGETFRSEISFYLSNNKVFFISVIRFEYEKPIYEDSNPKIKNTISRHFYLDQNEKLCAWYLDNVKQENNSETEEFVPYLISTANKNK